MVTRNSRSWQWRTRTGSHLKQAPLCSYRNRWRHLRASDKKKESGKRKLFLRPATCYIRARTHLFSCARNLHLPHIGLPAQPFYTHTNNTAWNYVTPPRKTKQGKTKLLQPPLPEAAHRPRRRRHRHRRSRHRKSGKLLPKQASPPCYVRPNPKLYVALFFRFQWYAEPALLRWVCLPDQAREANIGGIIRGATPPLITPPLL